MYVAEDDFWKLGNWVMERYRYKNAYKRAFDKGLIKEIFSVVDWVGSIFLAYFFRLNLSAVLPLNNLNEFTKEILSSIIIFICAFIIFRLIGNIISKGMKEVSTSVMGDAIISKLQ